MANAEALQMLKAGAERWQQWRKERHRRDLAFPEIGKPIDLRDADLQRLNLQDFNLARVDFTGANLSKTYLDRADLSFGSLGSTRLNGASLTRATLVSTHLEAADLSRANLRNAICEGTAFDGASLVEATLTNARLLNCTMSGADLSRANASGIVWANIDLRGVRGLSEMNHQGPSTVGLDTVIASDGHIPDIFLRGCGVPDSVIAYVSSLAKSGQAIQLYSCFICHSSKDHDFCQRLHNDLQAAGVRCWFAPEDLKIGDRFRDEIEGAIRVHDKLLLVLSEHSVQSEWVATEVEGAFEREQRDRGRLVLFPVRLDEAVRDTSQAWAADIKRRRHIGDFSGWKDHDAYHRAFQRLLRDLRADGTGE